MSNASRTLLFDLAAGDWSDELCGLFGVPRDALPELVPSWGEIAVTDPRTFLDLELPIAGIAGGQQSALLGQTCFDEGDSKCTCGAGPSTALGAAFLAGLGTGVWASTDDLRETWQLDRSFAPDDGEGAHEASDAAHRKWIDAVDRSKGWTD